LAKSKVKVTSALALHVVVSQATVTRIIDRLDRAGLVRQQKASSDKRVANVSLTYAGRDKLDDAPELLQTEFLRKFRKREDWEQQMLRSTLMRIATMMDADDLAAALILLPGEIDSEA
jgi:DNA-binding MarR family transcriptional regulator